MCHALALLLFLARFALGLRGGQGCFDALVEALPLLAQILPLAYEFAHSARPCRHASRHLGERASGLRMLRTLCHQEGFIAQRCLLVGRRLRRPVGGNRFQQEQIRVRRRAIAGARASGLLQGHADICGLQ